MKTYVNPVYAYQKPADLDGAPRHWPVIVAGAGPVGLIAAIDLAQRGIDVLVLDDDDTVSVGSRAICWSKRTLDILDRLGCGERIAAKGVRWHVGRVFHRDHELYRFDLQPEPGHRRPAFVNLQQYWVEQYLVERVGELAHADLRWKHRIVGVTAQADRVAVRVSTPDGEYVVHADWLIAADGARSAVRRLLGLETEGQVFHDRFLIADIHMTSDFPSERWFWFDPPFHRNQSVLLHRQADDVWRIDFQLGWDADPEAELKPEAILPRLKAMLGENARFDIEWASVYTFQCRRMRAFRHGRTLFVGDAAHLVSPFGARGANSGIQDVDNLVWKLALVMEGSASESLLDSFNAERTLAADENIRASTRSTEFITPKHAASRLFRDAALSLARQHPFARSLVNSGRLSVPSVLADSPLSTADASGDRFGGVVELGGCAADAPVRGPRPAPDGEWLLGYLDDFTLLIYDAPMPSGGKETAEDALDCAIWRVAAPAERAESGSGPRTLVDRDGVFAQRYDARAGSCYLFRPDQHLCGRWRRFDADAIRSALARACAAPRRIAALETA